MQQRSADFAGHGGELEWSLADAGECLIDVGEEPFGKPSSLVAVPARGILEIGLGERPNDEPPSHSVQ
ncbi:MAG: hypothetical protein DMF86_20655 [Acidobacteria bacterium]|nr:MAG: hypothetical protein DMF86_20655 [Acidobacteriota bacterium]